MKRISVQGNASRRRTVQARSILARHFGFRNGEVDDYLAQAAKRERRKVTEIENAVIRLGRDLF